MNRLSENVAFVDLTDADKKAAWAAWAVIATALPAIIESFYEHLRSIDQDYPLHGIDMPRLKAQQFAYWEMIFTGNLAGAAELQNKRIVAKHKARDIPLSTYLGSYGWFGTHFMQAVTSTPLPDGVSVGAAMTAIHKLIVLDMMTASDAYDSFAVL